MRGIDLVNFGGTLRVILMLSRVYFPPDPEPQAGCHVCCMYFFSSHVQYGDIARPLS